MMRPRFPSGVTRAAGHLEGTSRGVWLLDQLADRWGVQRRLMLSIWSSRSNRAENVRQIPPGDPSYQLVYGRREDAESINRAIDDHGYLQRARSVGAQRQLFDLLCHAVRTNLIAQHLYGHQANARAPAA